MKVRYWKSERKRVRECLPFKSQLNPDFREVHSELSRNCRKNVRYNLGFPAPATHDDASPDASHSIVAGLRQNFARKNILFCGTIAKLSRSPPYPSWWSCHIKSITGTFWSTTISFRKPRSAQCTFNIETISSQCHLARGSCKNLKLKSLWILKFL